MLIDGDCFMAFELLENLGGIVIDRPKELLLDMILGKTERIRHDRVEPDLEARIFWRKLAAHEPAIADREDLELSSLVGPPAEQKLRDIVVLHTARMPRDFWCSKQPIA